MKKILLSGLLVSFISSCAGHYQPLTPKLKPRLTHYSAIRSDKGLRDGVVELRKVRFTKWDKNHNGLLTPNEVSDENMKIPGIIEGFHSYDTNGNKEIDLKEFLREDVIAFWMKLIRPKLETQFAKHDKDSNRLITKEEQSKLKLFFSPWPELHGGDLNQDDVITFSEYEDAYMTVLPFFQQGQETLDLN